MNKSTGQTPQDNQSQTAKPGAAQPPSTAEIANPGKSEDLKIPAPSMERFLMINVCKGATQAQIVAAVEEALKTIENPFLQLSTPSKGKDPEISALSSGMRPGQVLQMFVKQEGW